MRKAFHDAQDLGLATEIATPVHAMDSHHERLTTELLRLRGATRSASPPAR